MAPAPQVWLITGCSSGFGEQFVRQALARGDQVIATGRNTATRLAHLAETGAAILDLDISASQDEITAKLNEATQVYGKIDFVVNNAGYIESGAVEELSIERVQRSLDTNYFGHLKVARAILPHFREQKSGTMAFVGSVGGWGGVPGSSAYVAAKYALEGLTECLQAEFAALFSPDIRFIIFEPGYFSTEVFSPKNIIHPPSSLPEYEGFNAVAAQNERLLYEGQNGDARKAVARMIDVLTGSGMASGKELPPRLPLGSDCLAVVRNKCLATLKICDEWEKLIVSTDASKETDAPAESRV